MYIFLINRKACTIWDAAFSMSCQNAIAAIQVLCFLPGTACLEFSQQMWCPVSQFPGQVRHIMTHSWQANKIHTSVCRVGPFDLPVSLQWVGRPKALFQAFFLIWLLSHTISLFLWILTPAFLQGNITSSSTFCLSATLLSPVQKPDLQFRRAFCDFSQSVLEA